MVRQFNTSVCETMSFFSLSDVNFFAVFLRQMILYESNYRKIMPNINKEVAIWDLQKLLSIVE